MTVTIKSSGIKLDLTQDTILNIEKNSPVFANSNSMSLPISLPATNKNKRVLYFPERLDLYADESNEKAYRGSPEIDVIVRQGAWQQYATMSILSCTMDTIEAVLYFHESSIFTKMEEVSLPQLMAGYYCTGGEPVDGESISEARERLFNYLNTLVKSYPKIVDKRESGTLDDYNLWKRMWMDLSSWAASQEFVLAPLFTEDGWLNKMKIYNNDVHELVANIDYTYITAFLRLDYVLHCIFEYFGYTLTIDFSSLSNEDEKSLFHLQWHSICILNNTMDALYPGRLYYSSLVPDISCKDFLLAIKAQFGCRFISKPDGNYSMIFLKNKLSNPTIQHLKWLSNKSLSFSFTAEYIPGDAIKNVTTANIFPHFMPNTGFDGHNMSPDIDAFDESYPTIHVPSMKGVCQRTTTSELDGEDTTKDTACPLSFACFSMAYICYWEGGQYPIPANAKKIFYPCVRKSCLEYTEIWEGQFDEQDVKDLPFTDTNESSTYYHFNREYNKITSEIDKISLLALQNTNDVADFDFTKPYLIQGRLCWPYKLSFELKEGSEQHVSMELIAPRKAINDNDDSA